MKTKAKFNCYKCEYPMEQILATFASVGRMPAIMKDTKKLNIKGNPYGIRSGWFNWPYNFDPVWLENCNGFKGKEEHVEA